jgi:long-chain fatty acid transport protein
MKTLRRLLLVAMSIGMVMANGLSLNSISVKAFGMGGAYVGYANDASAIYWNPAGLAGLDNHAMIGTSIIMPSGYYKYDAANIDADMVANTYFAPDIFVNYALDEKMAVGLGIYAPAGLGSEYEGEDLFNLLALVPGAGTYEWMTQIGVLNISPSFAYAFNDMISVGLAVNVYYAMFDFKRGDAQDFTGDMVPNPFQYTEESTGLGYGVNLGVMIRPNDDFSIGLTYRSKTTVTMDGDAEFGAFAKSKFERDVIWPTWISGGVAYHLNEDLTLVFDLQYSMWSELDVLTAKYTDLGSEGEFKLEWDDALQIRLGGEYKATDELTVRLGYYYDPAPAPDETLNFLFPSSTNNVFTFGGSYNLGTVELSAAGEYILGKERDIEAYPNAQTPENAPGKHKLDILAFAVGVSFNF